MKRALTLSLALMLVTALVMPTVAAAGVGPAPKTTGCVTIRQFDGPDGDVIQYRHEWAAFCAWKDKPARGTFSYYWMTIHPDGTEEVTWSMSWPVTAVTKVNDQTYTFFAAGSYGWTPLDGSSQPWATGLWKVTDAGEPGEDDVLQVFCGWCGIYHPVQNLGGNLQAH